VDFLTAAPGEISDFTSEVDPTQYANSETHAPFDRWMDRFIKIADFPWNEGAYLNAATYPYEKYLNHPTVMKKLEGFSRFHMKGLELKFILNGAPTQYGTILASYYPLPEFSGGKVDQPDGSLGFLMAHTCYPHTYLSVATSAGATMKVPFVCPKNCISLNDVRSKNPPFEMYRDAFRWQRETINLGELFLTSIGPLETVGVASSNPIDVSVYARPIDLFMWGPTTFDPQSDEYGVTPVSTVASVVASAAGMLASIPSIRPYMLATQLASGAMASVARMFGYSNPPVIDPVHVFMNRPTYGISSPEIPVQMDKLALDPKNELTIDPRTVGAPAADAMTMSYMMDRNVYVGASHWYGTDMQEAPLLAMHVSPEFCLEQNKGSLPGGAGAMTNYYGAAKVQMTPACHLAQVFKYWRGSIDFTFTVIASQFHRGRYVIEYEPAGRTADDGSGLLRQWVVDIKDSPTFTVTIDMCSDITWLPTTRTVFDNENDLNGTPMFTARALQPLDEFVPGNGTLRVRVLNELTSSAAESDIIMFVRTNCKNVEFACPMDLKGWPTTYETQSDTATLAAVTTDVTVADENVDTRTTPADSTIYQGEVVKSIRTLLQRANFFQTLSPYPAQPASDVVRNTIRRGYTYNVLTSTFYRMVVKWIFPRIGMQVGNSLSFNSAGWSKANSGDATPEIPFVYGKPTMISYMTPCYVGYRGGVAYRSALESNSSGAGGYHIELQGVTIERSSDKIRDYTADIGCGGTAFGHTTSDTQSTPRGNVISQQYLSNTISGASGMGVTNDVRYLDAVIPQYSRYRMLPANPVAQQNLSIGLEPDDPGYLYVPYVDEVDNVEVTAILQRADGNTPINSGDWLDAPKLNVYQQAGVDFTLLFYLAPPTMWSLRTGAALFDAP